MNAKNVHKPIRDNLTCATALYQQLREYRDAIAKSPYTQNELGTQVLAETKYSQTEPLETDLANRTQDARSKRLPSSSPNDDRLTKKQKTTEIHSNPEPHEGICDEALWKTVEHRKKNKKKIQSGNKQKRIRITGEVLAIKASSNKTYAEMLKHMKDTIDPIELGVEVNEMRRSKTGELLIKLKNGEGKADILKEVIINTLGEDVAVRTITRNSNIDIRDMDESVEEQEIIDALKTVTGIQEEQTFKILNIRESYARTKQALVQMPSHISDRVIAERRIRIGWIRCRVRIKERAKKCFKCLDQGHLSKDCPGPDRTNVCSKCCKPGHKFRECEEKPRCVICQEAGLQQVEHYIGSARCVANRKMQNNHHD